MNRDAIISCQGLQKRYSCKLALNGLTLDCLLYTSMATFHW